MSETITVTRLRENIYQAIDRVLETGEPLRITRHGRVLLIVPDDDPPIRLNLDKLPRRHVTSLSAEELAAITWEYPFDEDE